MSLFSAQECYCRTCGAKLFRVLSAPGMTEFCDVKCLDEFQWRRTLSTLGKPYRHEPIHLTHVVAGKELIYCLSDLAERNKDKRFTSDPDRATCQDCTDEAKVREGLRKKWDELRGG